MSLSPILLTVYNRPIHTKDTLNALQNNNLAKESILYIACDGPKDNEQDKINVKSVRKIIRTFKTFKKVNIIESQYNKGLANSIINNVTNVIKKHEKIIVLEDDVITSKYFLDYMNRALDIYKDKTKVMAISGFQYRIKNLPETLFFRKICSFGWATWNDRWRFFEKDAYKLLKEIEKRNLQNDFNLNGAVQLSKMLENQCKGRIDSWAIRWETSIYLNKGLVLWPGKSFISNIGFDKTATHTKNFNFLYNNISDPNLKIENFEDQIFEKKEIYEKFRNWFLEEVSLKMRIKKKIFFIYYKLKKFLKL